MSEPNLTLLPEGGGYEDNIDAVFRTLPQLLMDINEERLQRLGIVDADYTSRNGGFAARWKTFTGILQKAEYIINSPLDQTYTGSIIADYRRSVYGLCLTIKGMACWKVLLNRPLVQGNHKNS